MKKAFGNSHFKCYFNFLFNHKWTIAIKKDKLSWSEIASLTGYRNIAEEIYRIKAIPYNALIDNKGVIIAKKIHKNELEEKLNKILKQKIL